EHDVEQDDLHDGGDKDAAASQRLRYVDHLQLVVDLPRGLEDEEETAREQDEVASGHAAPQDLEEGTGEAHDPRDREQQADAHADGEDEAEPAREALLPGGEAADQDGDEDDVVDAEDDLHRRERDQGDEAFGSPERVHGEHYARGGRSARAGRTVALDTRRRLTERSTPTGTGLPQIADHQPALTFAASPSWWPLPN